MKFCRWPAGSPLGTNYFPMCFLRWIFDWRSDSGIFFINFYRPIDGKFRHISGGYWN